MAAAEHAVTIHDERSMELPLLPPNQALEALKDVFCGSVSHSKIPIESVWYLLSIRLQEWPARSLNTLSTP